MNGTQEDPAKKTWRFERWLLTRSDAWVYLLLVGWLFLAMQLGYDFARWRLGADHSDWLLFGMRFAAVAVGSIGVFLSAFNRGWWAGQKHGESWGRYFQSVDDSIQVAKYRESGVSPEPSKDE